MLQAHGCRVQLKTLFEKLSKLPVHGVGQLVDTIFGQYVHLINYASHQREERIPQPARQAELIKLVFELFSDFAQTAARVTGTGVGEHQVLNRTKMRRCHERNEAAGLFGQKPKFFFASLK